MISYRNNFKFLVFGLLTAIFLIWFFGDIVKPFFVAAIIAYFLDPAVDKMVKMGLSRIFAIVLVMIFAIGCFGFIFSVLIPSLIRQVNLLIISLPGLLEILIVKVKTQFPVLIEQSSFFEEIILEVINSSKIKISNFGTFSVLYKKERIGRNPKTKIAAKIKPRKVVKFKPSLILKNKLNRDEL